MPSARKISWFKGYSLSFLIYLVLLSIYLWVTAEHSIPDELKGTSADPATFLTADQLRQSTVYSALRNGLYFLSIPWEWGIYLLLLLGGHAKRWQDRIDQKIRPAFLKLPIAVAMLQGTIFLWFLPLRAIGYSLSRYYGISTQSVVSWLRDKAIAFGIQYLTLLLITAVAFWLIARGGRWWLKLWLLSVPFTLLLMFIQPVVINPLFNQFTRLSDPVLEQKIISLASKANIPAERVYEVNMSEKTNALNAYVNGIGGSLRIVLWDTTLMRMNEPEILLIMAHEMGHYVMHHLEWSAVGAIASSFFLIWLGSRGLIYMIQRWGSSIGINKPNEIAALPLILLMLSVLTLVSSPIANAVSRNAEQAADQYAFELIGSPQGAVSMYQKLASSSLSNVNPPFLVKLFSSTHPSIMERIIHAESYHPNQKQ